MKNQNGFSPIIILGATIILMFLLGGMYYLSKSNKTQSETLPDPQTMQINNPTESALPTLSPSSIVQQQDIDMVLKAKDDLANVHNVPMESVQIVSMEEATWSDTCLGGPVHNRCGVKTDIPGYKVIFKVNGKEYEYHTGGEFYRNIDR